MGTNADSTAAKSKLISDDYFHRKDGRVEEEVMLNNGTTPPPSSNRTCGFPASGSRVNLHRAVTLRFNLSLKEDTFPGSPTVSAQASVVGLSSKRRSSLLTQIRPHSDPFAPRSLLASALLWVRPTPVPGPRALMHSHTKPMARPPPGRVSQVPRPIFPRALSPTTPESPTAALAHCFTADVRLPLLRQTGHSRLA